MNQSITLNAPCDYNPRYAPAGAKKPYVARIKGRAAGALKFDREFLGQSVEILPGDEGLFEVQDVDKKGQFSRHYRVILSHPEHGLLLSRDCEDVANQIAQRLDAGDDIHDIVDITNLGPSQRVAGRTIFTATVRPAGRGPKPADVPAIVAQIRALLAPLSPADVAAVLAALAEDASQVPAR